MPGVLGVIGHLPTRWKFHEVVNAKTKDVVLGQLETIRPSRVLVAADFGFGLVAAEAAQAIGIPLALVLPFDGFDVSWPQESREMLSRLRDSALMTHVVSPTGFSTKAYRQRNEYLVDNSSSLLVLHNGSARSEVAHSVAMAGSKGLPVINLWDRFLAAQSASEG